MSVMTHAMNETTPLYPVGLNSSATTSSNDTGLLDNYPLCALNSSHIMTFSEEMTLTVIVYRRLIPALCLIGILGNILNLVVLTHKSWKHLGRLEMFAKTGLVALATADMGVCLSVLPWGFIYYSKAAISSRLTFRIIYTAYSPFVINMFMLASTLFTVSLAVGRYLAIGWPIEMRARINKTFTRIMILGVLVTSIIFNLPHLWEYNLENCTANETTYFYVTYGLMYERKPHLIYSCLYFTVAIALPSVILAFCNFFLIRNIHRSRQHRLSTIYRRHEESQHIMTLVLIIIVLMHIILVTPGGITNFLAKVFKVVRTSSTYAVTVAVVNVMEICNYTFNFVLYCALNKNFRMVIRRVFEACCVICGCREPRPVVCHNGELSPQTLHERVTLFSTI